MKHFLEGLLIAIGLMLGFCLPFFVADFHQLSTDIHSIVSKMHLEEIV